MGQSQSININDLNEANPSAVSNLVRMIYLYNPYTNKKYVLIGELHKYGRIDTRYAIYHETYERLRSLYLENYDKKVSVYLEEDTINDYQARFPNFDHPESKNIITHYCDNFRSSLNQCIDYTLGDIWSFVDYDKIKDKIAVVYEIYNKLFLSIRDEFNSERSVEESVSKILSIINIQLAPLNIILSNDNPKVRAYTIENIPVQGEIKLYDEKKDALADQAVDQLRIFLTLLFAERVSPGNYPDGLKRKKINNYFTNIETSEIDYDVSGQTLVNKTNTIFESERKELANREELTEEEKTEHESQLIRSMYSDLIFETLNKLSRWMYDLNHILIFNNTTTDLSISFCGDNHVQNIIYLLSSLNYSIVKTYQTELNGEGLNDNYKRDNITAVMRPEKIANLVIDIATKHVYTLFDSYEELALYLKYDTSAEGIKLLKQKIFDKFGFTPNDNYAEFLRSIETNHKFITPNPERYGILGGAGPKSTELFMLGFIGLTQLFAICAVICLVILIIYFIYVIYAYHSKKMYKWHFKN